MLWGVQPFVLRDVGEYHEQIVDRVDDFLLSRDIVAPGDPARDPDGLADLSTGEDEPAACPPCACVTGVAGCLETRKAKGFASISDP
jgi:hypothetical protein